MTIAKALPKVTPDVMVLWMMVGLISLMMGASFFYWILKTVKNPFIIQDKLFYRKESTIYYDRDFKIYRNPCHFRKNRQGKGTILFKQGESMIQ